jgi:glutathione S-transferase
MGLEATPEHPDAQAARDAARQYSRRMEGVLADREYLAETYSYADIAFYMAQLFGAREGAPMTAETPNLLAWRERMTARPAVRKVAGAMAGYLASIDHPVPDFLRGLD